MISTREYIGSIPKGMRKIIISERPPIELPHLAVNQTLIAEINTGNLKTTLSYKVVKFGPNGVYLRFENALLRTDPDRLARQGIIDDSLGTAKVVGVSVPKGGQNGYK